MWQLLQQNDANNDTEMCKENTPKKRDYSRRNYSGSTTSCYPVEVGNHYSRVLKERKNKVQNLDHCQSFIHIGQKGILTVYQLKMHKEVSPIT